MAFAPDNPRNTAGTTPHPESVPATTLQAWRPRGVGAITRAELRLDYLTFVVPHHALEPVAQRVWCACGVLPDGIGLNSDSAILPCPGGAIIRRRKRSARLAIPGSALDNMTSDVQLNLMRDLLALELRCTRIDIGLDLFGTGLRLLQKMREAVKRRELCGLRRAEVLTDQDTGAETLYLGRRGRRGSGRFVRVYDKGLERRSRPAGEWVRFEVEFSGQPAQVVAPVLVAAFVGLPQFGGQAWYDIALRFVLGALDFHVVTGHQALQRRPPSDFWNQFRQSIEPIRVRPAPRRSSSLERFRNFLRKSVAPRVVQMARATGQSAGKVFEDLVNASFLPPISKPPSAAVIEYVAACRAASAERA